MNDVLEKALKSANKLLPDLQKYIPGIYTLAVRWILPVLAVFIFARCILPLLHNRKQNTVWGYLLMPSGDRLPLTHWENSIGRSRISDIVINLPVISRSHAVLTWHGDAWTVSDLGSKGGVRVNGEKVDGSAPVRAGDVLSLAGVDLTLLPPDEENVDLPYRGRLFRLARVGEKRNSGFTLLLLVFFQLLGGLQLCLSAGDAAKAEIAASFLVLIVVEFLHYIISRRSGNYFELELLAYFLCGLGLFAAAAASPDSLYKELAALIIGVCAFVALSFVIRDLDRARKLKYVFVVLAVVLMVLTLAIGETRNGAKNWIDLGVITFQPMEFVKIAFVLAGAATLDRLLTTRNLGSFIAFSGVCVGTLALTKDFGTALVFFTTFLVIAFMRSGDIRTIALITAGAVIGALIVLTFIPYVASRFEAWGHVWQYADTSGYQQTRTMIAAASGGLLGTGGGNGFLTQVAAADTDLVFGVLCEEWGFIIALTAVLSIAFLSFFAAFSVGRCRSSFYAIAACGAATIFLAQTALNLFGSVDILPLTGVTMPFVSNGGTSMITSWCLLAFIRSADGRLGLAGEPQAAYGPED